MAYKIYTEEEILNTVSLRSIIRTALSEGGEVTTEEKIDSFMGTENMRAYINRLAIEVTNLQHKGDPIEDCLF